MEKSNHVDNWCRYGDGIPEVPTTTQITVEKSLHENNPSNESSKLVSKRIH